MTTARPTRRRRRVILGVLTALVVVLAGTAYLVYRVLPEHRIALLVDASEVRTDTVDGSASHFAAIAGAVGSAARNVGDDDALALRRFGGACGDAASTAEVVRSGTGQGQRIADAARGVTAAGQATLEGGILAAIEDFSGWWPPRGRKTNRIVVVTSHGVDACATDQAGVAASIADRVAAAGLQLEFRYVGFRVPAKQRDGLRLLASGTGAPEPAFVETPTDLDETLARVTLPAPLDAKQIDLPDPTTAPPTPVVEPLPALVWIAVAVTSFQVTISSDTPGTVPCVRQDTFAKKECSFVVPGDTTMELTAKVTGRIPKPEPFDRAFNGKPIWFGCDEGPRSPIPASPDTIEIGPRTNTYPGATDRCTLRLTTGRAICLSTTDLENFGGAAACFGIWAERPRFNLKRGTTTCDPCVPAGKTD